MAASPGSTPAVELFSTSILSNHKVRSRHERFTGVFAIKKIPYVYHDLASDEDAKTRWRRKTKDPQLPGILVNNEWRGTYEEFEEAVEFGELEMFLGIDPVSSVPAQQQQQTEAAPPVSATSAASASVEPPIHAAQQATSAKDPSLYPTIHFAPEGSGKRAEPTADEFIASLGLADDSLTEADADALLASIGTPEGIKSAQTHKKAFTPSPEAAVKPLRLARMGKATGSSSAAGAALAGEGSTRAPGTSPRSPPVARYSISQRSGKALAAEASALVTNRKTSGALLREAVSQGKNLDEALEQSKIKDIVSNEDLDHLFASLGLKDADLAEDEVEAFLEAGAIPDGLQSGGSRLTRSSTKADKVRDEVAAREVAQRAREKGYGVGTGPTLPTAAAAGTLPEAIAEDEAETETDAAAPAKASLAEALEITELKAGVAGEAAEGTTGSQVIKPDDPAEAVGAEPKTLVEASPANAADEEAAVAEADADKEVAATGKGDEPADTAGDAPAPTATEAVTEVEQEVGRNKDTVAAAQAQEDEPVSAADADLAEGAKEPPQGTDAQVPAEAASVEEEQEPAAVDAEAAEAATADPSAPTEDATGQGTAGETKTTPKATADEASAEVETVAPSKVGAEPSVGDAASDGAAAAVESGEGAVEPAPAVAADAEADGSQKTAAAADVDGDAVVASSKTDDDASAPATAPAAAPATAPLQPISPNATTSDSKSDAVDASASSAVAVAASAAAAAAATVAAAAGSTTTAAAATASKTKSRPPKLRSPSPTRSARRAIDVSRPNAAPPPPLPALPAVPPTTTAPISPSPLSPTPRKSMLPFSKTFGKKSQQQQQVFPSSTSPPSKTTTMAKTTTKAKEDPPPPPPPPMTTAAGGAAAKGHHQRTISEILREADLVLGQGYDSGSDAEDDDGLGAESLDTEFR
ncbi:uncharacterized protein PFL1_05216 [Pseudozyma flocculosa PF-1]|uniref:SH3 domain-containing protein n=2 Tax=Pseudozyma flocculosa TaxID=84751 RepID=A0A5C3F587_9BASI|nr:uncharacterized protein PFL1_05216 [Pseudozyma flocculosa PF-1]EPQ27293.1 hypothetical protein PFL1_05216 [Pseudozyma flocculosa PF-1]SPO39664.1 uncharacterized protein PSFLO_05145 [Pseudozyma flocculosa]